MQKHVSFRIGPMMIHIFRKAEWNGNQHFIYDRIHLKSDLYLNLDIQKKCEHFPFSLCESINTSCGYTRSIIFKTISGRNYLFV